MGKRTYRIIALFLSMLMLACIGAVAFAVDEETLPAEASESTADAPTTSADKADYYSRIADMNEDWMLNTADARHILRLAVGLDWVKDPDWLPKGMVFGDIDDNGKLTTADARSTLRVSLKLNTVSEVVEAALSDPESTSSATVPSGSDAPDSTTTPAADTTTTQPAETTNPNAVVGYLCEPYAAQLTTASGASYVLASDGRNCYMALSDTLGGLGIYVDADGNTYLLNTADGEYALFSGDLLSKLGYTPSRVRDFVSAYSLPEVGIFEGWTVSEEILDMIPYTVATRGDITYRYYADGSFYSATGVTFDGTEVEFTALEAFEDITDYTDILDDSSEISTNMFIIKNGLSILF